jgi:hypothetical protein
LALKLMVVFSLLYAFCNTFTQIFISGKITDAFCNGVLIVLLLNILISKITLFRIRLVFDFYNYVTLGVATASYLKHCLKPQQILLKGYSHEKLSKIRVWGGSL